MKKIIIMMILCFSLSSITIAEAKTEYPVNPKVSHDVFDVFMQELFYKDILDNVRKFYKDETLSVAIKGSIKLSEDKEGRYIIKFIIIPHSKFMGKKGKISRTDTLTLRVDPFLLGTQSKDRNSAVTFLDLKHNNSTRQN
ncbi:hypothetical protein [Bacillus stercoris]|uniref:hypothetical protein n=1 Tax=Bacillus stercoris TaxID=2054641 RepID=UPI003A8C5C29